MATTGYYSSNFLDQQIHSNWASTPTYLWPSIKEINNFWDEEIAMPKSYCDCKPIPENLIPYNQQLLDYYQQSSPEIKTRPLGMKLCCALKLAKQMK